MGANLEQSGQYDRASENQLNALASNVISSDDVHLVNDEKERIWKQIAGAIEFTDDEKRNLKEELDAKDDSDVKEIREFSYKVQKQRDEVRALVDLYTDAIDSHRDVFGVDSKRGINAADQYIADFMRQPAEEKRKWLEQLQSDIDDRIELYRRAAQLMPDRMEYVRTLRRSELKALLTEVEESQRKMRSCENLLERNGHLFSETEMEEIREELADATREDQSRILKEVTDELNERTELKKTFDALPDQYRKLCGNFAEMPIDEKRVAIARVDEKVTTDYRDLQRNHPLSQHISEDGKNQAYEAYIRQLPVDKKIEALRMLDGQFQFEKKLSDQYEGLLDRLEETGVKPSDVEMKRIGFYGAGYEKKKNDLLPALKAQLEKIEEEQEEAEELGDEYKVLLENAQEEGYINEKTLTRCLEWWGKQALDKKRETIARFDELLSPRVVLTERFRKLPEEVQDEYSGVNSKRDFYALNHHERMALVVELEKIVQEDEAKKKEEGEGEDDLEAAETDEQKIAALTKLATAAERQKKYKKAAKFYRQILELDPEDEIAASRLEIIEAKIEENEEEEEEDSAGHAEIMDEDEEEHDDGNRESELAELIEEAAEESEVEKELEDIAIQETLAEEAVGSENQSHEVEARYRLDVEEDDMQIAEDLSEATDGEMILNDDGEAEEIVTIRNGLEGLSKEKKDALKDVAVFDILKDAEQDTWMHSLQLVNAQGQKISAKKGMEEAEKMRDRLKGEIAKSAHQKAKTRGIDATRDELKKVVNDNDLEFDLNQAA